METLTMKAVAVRPGEPGSAHLREVRRPRLEEINSGMGVEVRVLAVGVDGTDRELVLGKYGRAPEAADYLIIGHEAVGQVQDVGPEVEHLKPSDYVVGTVRRPSFTVYDAIGRSDLTTSDEYLERGICGLHGYLAEFFVDEEINLIALPPVLVEVGVLVEPLSVVEKGLDTAWQIQRRLNIWHPRNAAVIGCGSIGLLAALALRQKGLEVTCYDIEESGIKADLAAAIGCRYVRVKDSSNGQPLTSDCYDLMFEATGCASVVFQSCRCLSPNGIMVLCSITKDEETMSIPSDRINLDFVLGNRALFGTVSSSRWHFNAAVSTLLRAHAEHPGWTRSLLTHRFQGLESFADAIRTLADPIGRIKTYIELCAVGPRKSQGELVR